MESEVDLSQLGPATLLATRTGLRACDDAIEIYEGIQTSRKLTTEESRDLIAWRGVRHTLLTLQHPPPYKIGASHAPLADPVT